MSHDCRLCRVVNVLILSCKNGCWLEAKNNPLRSSSRLRPKIIKEIEVVREVPVEVVKEIEVIKEIVVTKEVPVEIIREVEVVKV